MNLRTLNVADLSWHELAGVVFNHDCPIARQVCLDEMRGRRSLLHAHICRTV